jgi:hypothetical protein
VKDLRKLIYSLLDACDRECVEMAHGVRRIVTLGAACVAASKGHLPLVKHLAMSATPWNQKEIVWASLECENPRMIEWACGPNRCYLDWTEREDVMKSLLEKGMFDLAWFFNVKRSFPFPDSTYHWCAIHKNLDFALKIHKKWPRHHVTHYSSLLDTIIQFTDVRFFRWATLIKKIRASAEQMERAVEKWPELGRRPEKRIKL